MNVSKLKALLLKMVIQHGADRVVKVLAEHFYDLAAAEKRELQRVYPSVFQRERYDCVFDIARQLTDVADQIQRLP
jgi:hypothetical protein